MTKFPGLAIVAGVSKTITRLLALVAVVSVSGIHLVGMQFGAWAFMMGDNERQQEAGSFSRLAAEVVSGTHPCQRCLVTRAAALEAHEPGNDERGIPHHDAGDLRLVPAGGRVFRLEPPMSRWIAHSLSSETEPVTPADTPPTPPPRVMVFSSAA